MKQTVLTASLIWISGFLFAQNETNIWYFGYGFGMDFNPGSPMLLTNGNIWTQEACGTVCDANGDLLFYTSGVTIWNKNHQIMANGNNLSSNTSSSQTLILRQPGSQNMFYVFSCGLWGLFDDLHYSVVDMSLQSGLGEVVTKNIPLLSTHRERVTAVYHTNNQDIWVIAQNHGTSDYQAILLGPTGFAGPPVVSPAGTTIPASNSSIGYMKPSHNGTMLAFANAHFDQVEVFDFDRTTGVVSNQRIIPVATGENPYGVEFSPNDALLYVSTGSQTDSYLYQYDLTAGSVSDIINSRVTLFQTPDPYVNGALQLAPDNNIYFSIFTRDHLGIISAPDTYGTGCGFVANGFFLDDNNHSLGLPESLPRPILTTLDVSILADGVPCSGSQIQLDASLPGATSYLWSTGSNQSSIHVSNTGTYWVKVTTVSGIGVDTIQVTFDSCYVALELPNIITPNSDGLNDVFSPRLSEGIEKMQTRIFDRWGKQLYDSDSPDIDWDGTVNKKPVSDGTYYWVIRYRDIYNRGHVSTGHVMVIR